MFWRLLPDVRGPERSRFLFFAGLSTLIGAAQTLGWVGAEALFLAREGADRLPGAFVAASLLAVLGSLPYAAVVGRARNDRLFVWMLLAAAALLLALGGAASFLGLFCFVYLTQAIFLNHFWTFASDYFDTLTAKRLFPLFAVGASTGAVLGGALAIGLVQVAGPLSLVVGWSAGLAGAALALRGARHQLRRWGPLELDELDETSLEGMRAAARYLRASPLGHWMVAAAVGMVISLFVAQYLYSQLFEERYGNAEDLARVFGIFAAATNAVEIGIELWVTPRLIARLGVPRANLIHPVLTLLSFGALLPATAWGGWVARGNREMLEHSMAAPVRSLVYNALPLRFRGRTRAFVEGVVVYGAMALAGAVLYPLADPARSWTWLCAAGAVASLLYLGATAMARREYLRTLLAELRAGRLDLDSVGDAIGSWEAERLAGLWEEMLRREGERPSRTLLRLVPVLAGRGIDEPLRRAASHPSPAVRRACLEASRDPALASAALADPDPDVRAAAAVRAGAEGAALLEKMARSPTGAEAVAAFRAASSLPCEAALARSEDPDPQVRAAALECLARSGADAEIDAAKVEAALAEPDAGVRRAAVALYARLGPERSSAALARALADPDPAVRDAAIDAHGSLPEGGLAAVAPLLRAEREGAVEGALEVAARAGNPGRDLLREELRHHVRELWADLLAAGVAPGRLLRELHLDSMLRHRRLALRILRHVEQPGVVAGIERALRFGPERARADALEALSHLGDRDSAQLLVLLHESGPLEDRAARAAQLLGRLAPQQHPQSLEAEAMERLLALKQVPLFAQLSLEQLDAVLRLTRELTYLAGEPIVREGEPGGELYLLLEGSVRVLKDLGGPGETLLATQGPGSYFGEMAVLDDDPRSASVVAAEPTRVLALHGQRLKELVQQMPEIAFEIFRVLTARVRAAESRLRRS